MPDAIVSPSAKFKSPVRKYFGLQQAKNGDKVDSSLTMQSQNKEHPGFSFDPTPQVLTLDYLK